MKRSSIIILFSVLALTGHAERLFAFHEDATWVNSIPGAWIPTGGTNGCNGAVQAVFPHSSGVIYVGGSFTLCGGAEVNGVAIYDPDTDTFKGFDESVFGDGRGKAYVSALAIYEDDLYVGGIFRAFGRDYHLARWDGEAWHWMGPDGGDDTRGQVRTLAIWNDQLCAGGRFIQAGSVNANGVACWDGEIWNALASGGEAGVDGQFASVDVLSVLGGDLYVGGWFERAGDTPAKGLARWDGFAWHSVGDEDSTDVQRQVRAAAVFNGELYVAGRVSEPGVGSSSSLRTWDGSRWLEVTHDWLVGEGGRITAMATANNQLVVAASVYEERSAGTGFVTARAGSWDGEIWQEIDIGITEYRGESIFTIAGLGDELFMGGQFNAAAGLSASNLIRKTGTQWKLLDRKHDGGVNGAVAVLHVSGDYVYAGGQFTRIGGVTAHGVARWDGASWAALEGSGLDGVDGAVYAIATAGDRVYVGGEFNQADDLFAGSIAYWDDDGWHALGGEGYNGVNGNVYALASKGDSVYVGGDFFSAHGIWADNVALWTGSSWEALGDENTQGISGHRSRVNALAILGEKVYVGGKFFGAGDISSRNIAAWNGQYWEPLGDEENNGVGHEIGSLNTGVSALAIWNGELYVGGGFNVAGEVQTESLARWDGARWHEIETGWWSAQSENNGILAVTWTSKVTSLAVSDEALYVAGEFNTAGDAKARNVARWDGVRWNSLGAWRENGAWTPREREYIELPVRALAASQGHVLVGGAFSRAGADLSYGMATFAEHSDFTIEPGHTAFWFSPERAGEGWVLEILNGETALIYWFTFDEEGRQRWMMDVGAIDRNRIVFEEMHYTHGGQLGQTDPDAVERPIAGEMVMTFTDCENGALEYMAFDQRVGNNFQRLTRTAGLPCGDEGSGTGDSWAGLTGTWFDPAHAGEGFILQWMTHGEAVLIWFTFDNEGNQQWILGTGQESEGEIVFSDLHTTRGARFGSEFDPDEVVREDWGILRLSLDCESGAGTMRWDSVHPEFGSSQLSVQPLTRPQGVNCSMAD